MKKKNSFEAEPDHRRKVHHLMWRAGFGCSISELDELVKLSIPDLVDKLFKDSNAPSYIKVNYVRDELYYKPNKTQEEKKVIQRRKNAEKKELNVHWYEAMVEGKTTLRDKMALFWHDHFSCQHKKAPYMQAYLETIRSQALGSFSDMLHDISRNPAMLLYLNSRQNKKAHPNENFAREVMELFTLGRDNYTENDIMEAARAFTGWTLNDQNKFALRKNQHDFGEKTILGKTGNFNGNDVLNLLLKRDETAIHICGKLYRYLVNHDQNDTIVEQLAKNWRTKNYDIESLLREILTSDWFYSPENMGNFIKPPIVFLVGMQRSFHVTFNEINQTFFLQNILGQKLLAPPNVAGWPEGRLWIDGSRLVYRLTIPTLILKSSAFDTEALEDDLMEFSVNRKNFTLENTMDWDTILAELPQEKEVVLERLQEHFILSQEKITDVSSRLDEISWENKKLAIRDSLVALTSLPEYQMC